MKDPRFHECSFEGCDRFGPYGLPTFIGGMRKTLYWCKEHREAGQKANVVDLHKPSEVGKTEVPLPPKQAAQGTLF